MASYRSNVSSWVSSGPVDPDRKGNFISDDETDDDDGWNPPEETYDEEITRLDKVIKEKEEKRKNAKEQGKKEMNDLIGGSKLLDVDYDMIKKLYETTRYPEDDDKDKAWDEGVSEVLLAKGKQEMVTLYTTWQEKEAKEIKLFNEQFSNLDKADEWGYIERFEMKGDNNFTSDGDMVKLNKELVELAKGNKHIPKDVEVKRRFSKFWSVNFPYYPPLWKDERRGGFEIKEWDGKCKLTGCKDREKLMKAWIAASNTLKKKVEKRKEKKKDFIEKKEKAYGIKYPVKFFEWSDANAIKKGDILSWIKFKTEKKKKGGRKRTRRKKRRRRRKSTKKKRRRKRRRTKKKRRRRRR